MRFYCNPHVTNDAQLSVKSFQNEGLLQPLSETKNHANNQEAPIARAYWNWRVYHVMFCWDQEAFEVRAYYNNGGLPIAISSI